MSRFVLLLIFGVGLLGTGIYAEKLDLCKRKPYLLFCRDQSSDYEDTRQGFVKNSEPLPRPESHPKPRPEFSLHRDYPLRKSNHFYHSEKPRWVPPTIIYHDKDAETPIDFSRPNADDVAREIGEVMRDDPVSTNKIPDSSNSEINEDETNSGASTVPNSKDTEDLDYTTYRLRRAKLLRKLQDLDSDQLHRRYPSSNLYESSASPYSELRYESTYPYSGSYANSYYPTSYSAYGYSPSYSSWNPGYVGTGYGQPFNLGIGSGLNIGIPYVGPIGIGSGFGVSVG